jgi:hypothetical protein
MNRYRAKNGEKHLGIEHNMMSPGTQLFDENSPVLDGN